MFIPTLLLVAGIFCGGGIFSWICSALCRDARDKRLMLKMAVCLLLVALLVVGVGFLF
jgi:hypothetical protein